MIDLDRPTIILGDINLDLLKKCHHPMLQYLESQGFIQLVKSATHQQGGLLDPVFTSHHFKKHKVVIEQNCVYYSDHDLIIIRIKPS